MQHLNMSQDWVPRTFGRLELAAIIFASVAVLPTALFESTTPAILAAGIFFGHLFGLLIVIPALVVGVSLPFYLASHFGDQILVLHSPVLISSKFELYTIFDKMYGCFMNRNTGLFLVTTRKR